VDDEGTERVLARNAPVATEADQISSTENVREGSLPRSRRSGCERGTRNTVPLFNSLDPAT
jgi:hypothetical protein